MAYIDFSIEENRIRDLQSALRRHSGLTGVPRVAVAVDGNFDSATRDAVAEFQRYAGLPPTGEVTPETVAALNASLGAAENSLGAPRMISPFRGVTSVGRGEQSEIAAIIRILLTEVALHHDLPILPAGDIFDSDTEAAVTLFQTQSGLPVTGVVDLPTWNALALVYNNRDMQ